MGSGTGTGTGGRVRLIGRDPHGDIIDGYPPMPMPEPTPPKKSAEEQLEILVRGCVTVVPQEELLAKLRASVDGHRPLIVKAGFDPSAPDIHLGHTVLMRKMRDFQRLGHEVHFVVGDFTAMIGDPSGKSKTRPQLDREQVVRNAETYQSQAGKVLDASSTRLDYNATWLSQLGAEGFVRLAARVTVARMLEREDFSTRLDKGIPISVHEFLYPLCQAYDSVALVADVELGGTDQTWNLLMGRDIMREYGHAPQVVMTVPLLEGLDGTEKMSKSLGNAVGITEPSDEMFGKLMSISDVLMWRYFALLTERGESGAAQLAAEVAAGTLHPLEAKKRLAVSVVGEFHGATEAAAARARFEAQFQRRELPDEMPEASVSRSALPLELVALLVDNGLAASRSEARRLVTQGAVDVAGARVEDPYLAIGPDAPAEAVVKVGKRRYLRLRIEG